MKLDKGTFELKDGTPIRTYINENSIAVKKVLKRTGSFNLIRITAPLNQGGQSIRNVDPFTCFFNAPYGINTIKVACDMIDRGIGVLRSGEYPHPDTVKKSQRQTYSSKDVFIVHGHDSESKHAVARFLEKLKIHAIILHEQSNEGMTIIEKFEKHADVAFAIVLLTPDDIGKEKPKNTTGKKNGDASYRDRARQNVIFELGYFMGRIGRNKVCAIVSGDIEKPSDSDGILYIPYNSDNESWKLSLARELKAAGIEIDMNEV